VTDRLAGANRGAYPATHLLLTSGDAWRPRTFDSGTGRSSRTVDDAAVHALESGGVE